jgi:hypothetical protein
VRAHATAAPSPARSSPAAGPTTSTSKYYI